MNLDWFISPVTQDVVIAAGLIGSIVLWITTKVESYANRKALVELRESAEGSARSFGARLDSLCAAAEEASLQPAPSARVAPEMNFTLRTRAIRMNRRGESAATIAAALQMQREEVELLLKIDRLLETSSGV